MTELRHALILTYGDPKQGCEATALALQARSIAYLSELEAAGSIAKVHAYITLTGDRLVRSGMLVVEADRDAIQELFWSKEWKTQVAQARALLNHVCLEFAVGGPPASLAGPASVYAGAVAAIHSME